MQYAHLCALKFRVEFPSQVFKGYGVEESEIHGFIVTDFCRYSNKHEQKGGFPTFWP